MRSLLATAFLFAVPTWGAIPPSSLTPGFSEMSHARDDEIRVRFSDRAEDLSFRGFDLVVQGNGVAAVRTGPRRYDRASRWKATCRDGKVEMQNESGQWVRDSAQVWVSSLAGFITLGNGVPLRGRLQLRAMPEGCEVVNVLPLEKYLEGLVNSEFSSAWSPSAIDAQVIAARTYAVYQMRAARRGIGPRKTFDVESTIKDQVYEGVHKEDSLAAQSIERTRGKILTQNGRDPIKAYYHSTCGGRTELPAFVWGKPSPGFDRRVNCPYCKVAPRYEWEVKVGASDLSDALKKSDLPRPQFVQEGALEQISITTRSPAGRAKSVTSWWRWRGMRLRYDFEAGKIRSWLGVNRVRSTWWNELKVEGRGLVIRGRGFGHGVGMCQWGAKVMGEKHKTSREILSFYYPDVKVASIR